MHLYKQIPWIIFLIKLIFIFNNTFTINIINPKQIILITNFQFINLPIFKHRLKIPFLLHTTLLIVIILQSHEIFYFTPIQILIILIIIITISRYNTNIEPISIRKTKLKFNLNCFIFIKSLHSLQITTTALSHNNPLFISSPVLRIIFIMDKLKLIGRGFGQNLV